ncbi:hypothetical protein PVAP13_7KG110955 [Panicum virgatum]|uniref:Uncharacterized protein n=1 Tax=Panicum virgatum TaxID=38727 RepID=A0A8T0QDD0_PANVG|nr:hypothetical protein PVAP13_7KG110955 [Panicum virgatum]
MELWSRLPPPCLKVPRRLADSASSWSSAPADRFCPGSRPHAARRLRLIVELGAGRPPPPRLEAPRGSPPPPRRGAPAGRLRPGLRSCAAAGEGGRRHGGRGGRWRSAAAGESGRRCGSRGRASEHEHGEGGGAAARRAGVDRRVEERRGQRRKKLLAY